MLYYDINGFERYEMNCKKQVRNKKTGKFLTLDYKGRYYCTNDDNVKVKITLEEIYAVSLVTWTKDRTPIVGMDNLSVDNSGTIWLTDKPGLLMNHNNDYDHRYIYELGLNSWARTFFPNMQCPLKDAHLYLKSGGRISRNNVRLIHPSIYMPLFILPAFNMFMRAETGSSSGIKTTVINTKTGIHAKTGMMQANPEWGTHFNEQPHFILPYGGMEIKVPESRLDIELFQLRKVLTKMGLLRQ